MAGKLILVGTPIGNLSDFSSRAVEALEQCDFIAAEDTRVSLKLLNHFGIKKPMISYFEHNRRERGDQILARLLSGETACLITDAGMPAISDPGEEIVALCAQNAVEVCAVPGPSAVVTALALSGLSTGRFCFEGFLSTAKKARASHLEEVREEKRTLIFYEAPHKLTSTLSDMLKAWGDRRIALCREMTKLHEEVIRTTLAEAIERYREDKPKGEYVLVIEGKPDEIEEAETIDEVVKQAMARVIAGTARTEAAREAAKSSSFSKSEIYRRLLEAEESTSEEKISKEIDEPLEITLK